MEKELIIKSKSILLTERNETGRIISVFLGEGHAYRWMALMLCRALEDSKRVHCFCLLVRLWTLARCLRGRMGGRDAHMIPGDLIWKNQ